MQTSGNFSGLWVPLITPFSNGAIDHPALTRLVQRLRTTGIAGFVVCGSTGEAAALDPAEQLAVLDTVTQAAADLPLVMGLSGYHLPKTLAWVKTLATRPLAGLLVPPPHYVRPAQSGVLHWFNALADAGAQPLIVYDIPYRTGVAIELDSLRALSRHPAIRAVKDCGGDAGKTQALIAEGQLQVLAGEDAQIFSTVALGGSGAIAASAHLHTQRFVRVLQSLQQGDLAQAQALWRPLMPLIAALFREPNPGPLKALLAQQGLIHNELRAPMTAATAAHIQGLIQLSDTLASAA
ncbi:MAG: 4-hydroxy-tetrahydrodipicolinate synthase [Rhodoferax sp.]|uniref:4-hydroxy-tetrahydrodipicolinate synthase n=1 Tax=Rhodoferax sp. TaxID=50421 RepID=UPI00261EA34E|nr:4-hydroxy-tetrahydrodipicolinate synthase [Rhodoferax sp.]MDD5336730.1 4-hydroxy-tetrahydrodipicolinate synthase [Rhodoferax sp.]